MNSLESAKKKLNLLAEKQEDLLLEIKDNYDLEDEFYEDVSSIENALHEGEISLEWFEQRDIDYADDAVRCQQMLVRALELLELGDKKSVHNANKAFETLVSEARKVKKSKEEDAQKAQDTITLMNEIISVCEAYRKK